MENDNSNQNLNNNVQNINLRNTQNMQNTDSNNFQNLNNMQQNINYSNSVQMSNNVQISNNTQTKIDILNQIKALNFSIIEISLYLNTHPDDVRALSIHRRYCNELRNLKDKYQKMFGPLSIYCPCNKWRWLEEPWPWEGGMN